MLTACGGGPRKVERTGLRPASGPISAACLASDRKARSPGLCGCIQAAANRTLSSSEQRMAASFYDDPHAAQEVRQADGASSRRFWERYNNYAETATAFCS